MKLGTLELAVLERSLPRRGLRKGDVGTVVEKYADGAYVVEFVLPSGATKAVVTLTDRDVRAIKASDILAVRAAKPRGNSGRRTAARPTRASARKKGTPPARARTRRGPVRQAAPRVR